MAHVCQPVRVCLQTHLQGVPMRTQGEIEAAICEGVSRFEQDYMGRGPKDIYAYLLGDLLVVRLEGVLTAAEQHLVKSLPSEKGRDLLKQVRTHLIETARPIMESMVQEITGVKVLTLHHDISTPTGEEVVLSPLPSRRYTATQRRNRGAGSDRAVHNRGQLSIPGKLLDADVVVIDPGIFEHRIYGFDHGRWSGDVVNGRNDSLKYLASIWALITPVSPCQDAMRCSICSCRQSIWNWDSASPGPESR